MRRRSIYAQQTGGCDIPMTPLIDVVFQLLVFFLLTASFHAVEHVLPSHVSALTGTGPATRDETPPPEKDFDEVLIRVLWENGQPAWQVNRRSMPTLADLREALAGIAKIKADAPVIVHPDPEVPLGHVIDVYDVTRLQGFPKVQFAASEAI
jgi:biopolymer transport protein ExbD